MKCGNEFAAGVRFCPACGTPTAPSNVPSPLRSTPQTESTVPPQARGPKKPSHKTRNIAIGVTLILIVLILLGASLSQLPSENSTQAKYDVVIRYTETYAGNIGIFQAGANQIYLIISMQIENDGPTAFSVNAFYFHVTVNNVEYNVDAAAFTLNGYLQPTQVQTGGTVSGALAFLIPAGASNYTPSYQGIGTSPTINWIHQ